MASANGVGVESSRKELLDAQAHVYNHTFNFINSMSLNCAIQLGIPDIIHKHGKPMTLSQLADALPINKAKSHGLFRVMRILVHSKFFNKDVDEEEAYCLTQASRLLLRDDPISLAPYVISMIDPIMMDPFHNLSEWLQDECLNPFFTKHGKTFWELAGVDQNLNKKFNEAMACDAGFVTSILTTDCRQVFEGLESMVDVGGGTGETAKGIADAFPGLKCIVLDLPHVVGGLEGCENLRFFSGDMFESIPNADAIFLKWILHDWSDEDCVKILKKCKEAITPNGGKVIIVEMILEDQIEDEKATQTQFFFDVLMMVGLTGKQRSEKEWSQLFSAAGFGHYKMTPAALGLRSVIEVFP
ncbi:hypothetical protein C2S53_016113 [Perilla frutescens var. hirtella]|uniref:O-methyltransferase n=1 Tax=Perilla frutescens var. hirtella TaxID=608512 RepID=A0AAD4JMB0_PERFH|nr:hypothetical protein C2S53_016113 [Perilla frutescens var. hirtella]